MDLWAGSKWNKVLSYKGASSWFGSICVWFIWMERGYINRMYYMNNKPPHMVSSVKSKERDVDTVVSVNVIQSPKDTSSKDEYYQALTLKFCKDCKWCNKSNDSHLFWKCKHIMTNPSKLVANKDGISDRYCCNIRLVYPHCPWFEENTNIKSRTVPLQETDYE